MYLGLVFTKILYERTCYGGEMYFASSTQMISRRRLKVDTHDAWYE